MNTLRLEFEELQKRKYIGTELMFETSNNKYIEWLEQKIVKNCNIPPVSNCTNCRKEYERGIEDGKTIAEHGTTMWID